MKNFRRFMSFLLAVCMVASLLGITVYAADGDTVIDTVELSNIPTAAVGGTITAPAIAVPADANYTVSATWGGPTSDGTWTVFTEGTFGKSEYNLSINVTAADGYVFAEQDAIALVADLGEDSNWYVSSNGKTLYASVNYNFAEVVTSAAITGVPTGLTVGAAVAAPAIKVVEEAPYQVGYVEMYRENGNIWDEITETAYEKATYIVQVYLTPEFGYKFAQSREEMEILVDGASMDSHAHHSGYGLGETSIYLTFRYDLREEIKTVEISNIPTPEAGKAVNTTVKVPENANYTAELIWIDSATGEVATGTFDKKGYDMDISLSPKEGYRFADNTTITIDGVKVERTDYDGDASGDSGYVSGHVDLRTPITKIELTNIPEASKGQAVPTFDIKVPANAPYTVEAYWFKDYEELTETTFGAYNYDLYIDITPKEGYYFDSPVVYANGEILREYSSEEGWFTYTYETDNASVGRTFCLTDLISEVALTGGPKAEAGKAIDLSTIKAPEGANYEMGDAWIYDTQTYDGSETFEAGHTYYLDLYVHPKDGYRVDEDTLFTLDGVSPTSISLGEDGQYINLTYMLTVPGGEEDKVIDKVELTGVPALEKGKEVDLSAIKVPENANYEFYTFLENVEDYSDVSGALEDGKIYQLGVRVYPKAGYTFAEDVVLTVNGKQTDANYANKNQVLYTATADFKKYVDKVDLTEVPVAEVGKTAVTTAKISGDHTKSATVEWYVWDYERGEYVDFAGTFEKGKVYNRVVFINMEPGYGIKGTVTENGQIVKNIYSEDEGVYAYETEYSFVDQQITSVDLLITEPEIGKMFNEKNIQVSESSNCYIQMKYWYEMEDNEYWCNVFGEDSLYRAYVILTPMEGYVFSPDVLATVNGKNADIEIGGVTYIYLELASYFDTTEREEGTAAVRPDRITSAYDKETGEAVVDMSGTASTITKVELPVAALAKLASKEASLTIKTDAATITVDAVALAAIVKAAGENPVVTLEVKPIEKTALNEKQQAAISGYTVAGVLRAQILCNGTPITDFGGGAITVRVPFTPAEGTDGAHYAIWYVAEDGKITKLETTYADGALVVAMPYFSDYIIAYAPPASNPSTGDTFPVAILSAVALISAMGLAALAFTKKRSF